MRYAVPSNQGVFVIVDSREEPYLSGIVSGEHFHGHIEYLSVQEPTSAWEDLEIFHMFDWSSLYDVTETKSW